MIAPGIHHNRSLESARDERALRRVVFDGLMPIASFRRATVTTVIAVLAAGFRFERFVRRPARFLASAVQVRLDISEVPLSSGPDLPFDPVIRRRRIAIADCPNQRRMLSISLRRGAERDEEG